MTATFFFPRRNNSFILDLQSFQVHDFDDRTDQYLCEFYITIGVQGSCFENGFVPQLQPPLHSDHHAAYLPPVYLPQSHSQLHSIHSTNMRIMTYKEIVKIPPSTSRSRKSFTLKKMREHLQVLDASVRFSYTPYSLSPIAVPTHRPTDPPTQQLGKFTISSSSSIIHHPLSIIYHYHTFHPSIHT